MLCRGGCVEESHVLGSLNCLERCSWVRYSVQLGSLLGAAGFVTFFDVALYLLIVGGLLSFRFELLSFRFD